jgi:hypothetical protein
MSFSIIIIYQQNFSISAIVDLGFIKEKLETNVTYEFKIWDANLLVASHS